MLDSLIDLAKKRTDEEKYAERYATSLYQKGECLIDLKRYMEAFRYFSLAEDATFHLVKNKCSIIYYSGTVAIRKDLVDMKRLLEYCVDLLQSKADEKKQQLILEADNIMLMLNRQKMWRVISNIINNAIKFSPERGIINIKLQQKENTVLLSVHDNGIGIPADLKDKIFSMSPEASRLGTSGEESYGLGLSISQKIIEEHHGKIWFESSRGTGSVFYVELPCPN